MGDKSIQKRKYIIEKAALVFGEKGYKSVTMKDIVEACEISRGGLYLYFGSTKEIFEAVLESRSLTVAANQAEDELPGDRLLTFLEEKKNEILDDKDDLKVALYEYRFAHLQAEAGEAIDFERDLQRLQEIIEDGVATEWMDCEDPVAAARNILYTLEGVRVSARMRNITSKMVDDEIEYILGTLGLALEG